MEVSFSTSSFLRQAAVIDDINRLNDGISPMETAAVDFFSSHDSPAMMQKPTAQQRREQLQAEVLMHQRMLTREQQIGAILQCLTDRKNTTPLHIPDFIPHEVKDLIVEIATVEDEITRLENQIQHLQIEVTQEQETTRRRDYLKQSQRTPYSRPTTTTTSTTTTTTNNNTTAAGGDGYFSLQQLISRSSVEASNPTDHSDQKVVGFETKALHFISKAINGNYSLSDFSDKAASRLVTPQKENGFQERVIKRSNSVLKPSSSPLRDLRHPTPRPKDRINLAEFPIDLPRKPMASVPAIVEETMSTTTTSHGGQKVLPNKLSENIIKCLILIYVRLMRTSRQIEIEKSGPVSSRSTISSVSFRADAAGNNQVLSTSLILNKEYSKQQDPYGVFDLEDSIPRDIGPYKNLVVFSSTSLDPKCVSKATSIPLFQKLRGLLNSLQTVDLRSLSDQQKLAFWINMYNACIMHGYLQFGVPSSPAKLLSLMNKATLNIGGNIVNAQAIEHYILRKPSSPSITKEVAVNSHKLYTSACDQTKDTDRNALVFVVQTGGMKGDKSGKETVIRELYGLESPNPNVIFALSCGTRSSPAVRIYTSEGVISELEKSKLDYLQASISVTNTKKIALPELLTQNVLDFATDMETLLEWVCQQLPTSGSLRKSIVDCFRGQPHTSISRNASPTGTSVINLPYEFDFQYLLAI